MTRDWFPVKTTPWSLGITLCAAVLLLQFTPFPQRLNQWIYDLTITTWPATPSDQVALVAIDEYSLEQLGGWPWHRSYHAGLIRRLNDAGAERIVLDILFPEPGIGDTELALAMTEQNNVILPVYLTAPTRERLISEQLPTPELADAAATLGHAHVELDSDGVARGLYLYNGLPYRLWPAIALAATGQPPVSAEGSAPEYVNIRRDFRQVPLAGGPGALPTYSYARVLEGRIPFGALAGKTVFVGATAAGLGDVLPTPYSGSGRPMSGVEFHANAYSAWLQGQLKTPAPVWSQWLFTLLVLVVLALWLPRLRPAATVLACLTTLAAAGALYGLALFRWNLHLPPAYALLLPLMALPLTAVLRLAMISRFLSRQLDDMARTPGLSLPDAASRQPAQLIEQFRALLQPDGWLLAEDGKVLQCHAMSMAEAPPLPEPGAWQHQQQQSWIRLDRHGSEFLIGLELRNDLSREVIQRYLQQLSLLPETQYAPAEHRGESMSTRIERVRQATQRLTRIQAFIRHSFEHMPDGIIVTDELGVIRFANQHIQDWFGEPMPSLNGLPLVRLLDGHDPREHSPWHETVSETLTLRSSQTVDLTVKGKDFLIHFAPFALPGTAQSGIIANIADISELREQQRQHREAIDFISHDVRSPLVSQLALIEQMKRAPQHIDAQQLEQLGRLARRSYHLAEEFVQLARAEQLTETRFYDCELLAIVENARDSVCEQAIEKRISLQVQGTEDLWLKGNAELLERAVINLMTNAVQYSPEGSGVSVHVYRAGHLACLTIADEGSGIDPNELPHLFDRYHRQKRSELTGNHGTGLGLSFVKTVVEKHNGEITVDSDIDAGTTFTLKLPMADPMRQMP